jgi:hypothetical protein
VGRAAASTATCYQRIFHGRTDQVSHVRRDVAAHLDGCPAAADAILIASEIATNAIVFFLLGSRVAIATISGHADLRPALFDHLLLAAAFCRTCETGQPLSKAHQVQHGYHRTRRVREEIVHTRSAGAFFTVRVELNRDSARILWIECEDLGGQWQRRADEDRPHGLSIVDALAGPGNWGIDGDASGRVVWARLQW